MIAWQLNLALQQILKVSEVQRTMLLPIWSSALWIISDYLNDDVGRQQSEIPFDL